MKLLAKLALLPAKLKATLIVGTASLALITGIAGYSYYNGHHDAATKARPQIERAQDQASVSGLNVEGASELADRLDTYINQTQDGYAGAARAAVAAAKAEDANEALDPTRVARIRAADRELCKTYPSLVGCQSADDDVTMGSNPL